MKITLYISVCLFIVFQNNLQAQNYIPMDTITDWRVDTYSFGGSAENWYTYVGDTIIHNKSYRIIEYELFENYFVDLYFRENKTTRKVYKYEPDADSEILYYDFGLELGDDFFVEYSSAHFTVVDIDTIDSPAGPLKKWVLDNGNLYFTYTEAIGGSPLDYQYWIYVQDPVHYTTCGYHYCEKIFGDESCSPPPYRAITQIQDISICEGQNYLGHELPGTYADTLITQNGCDSIILTNLNVIQPVATSIDTTVCEGDSLYGINSSGTYSFNYLSQFGCDSIVTITIIVLPLPQIVETYALCPGDEVYGISEEGLYSILLPSETGCDTVLTVVITFLPIEDPACVTAILKLNPTHIKIFPNPVTDYLEFETDVQIIELNILDLHGHELIKIDKSSSGNNLLDVSSLVPGVYFLQVKRINGSSFQKFVKL